MFSKPHAIASILLCVSFGAQADQSQLTLDQIDEAARLQMMRSLGMNTPDKASSAPATQSKDATAQKVVTPRKPEADPAVFVGAFSDALGTTVLYQYQGAVYQARAGSRLLNGWTVEAVRDFQVYLSFQGRAWTAPIVAASATEPEPRSPAVDALSGLASPLPVGQPVSTQMPRVKGGN